MSPRDRARPARKAEDVTYADWNVTKYEGAGVAGGLVRRFMQRSADHVGSLARAGDAVLDVGVSEGTMTAFLAERLPQRRVVGIEYEEEGCRRFRSRFPAIELARGSAYEIPFPDRSFDVVCAFEVLEHLEDPRRALAEMARVARRDVVITVPYEPWFRAGNLARARYLSRLGNTPGHINHWGAGSLARLVRSEVPAAEIRRLFPWLLASGRVK